MKNFRLILSYDGTDFHGWQVQPNGRTVQEVLEKAILKVTGQGTRATASGRTDSGVHALAQVVNFRCDTRLEPPELQRALNAILPEDVVINELTYATEGFDARRTALSKRYQFRINDGPIQDVFARKYVYHIRKRLNESAMQNGAKFLVGRHDFHSFETEWPNRETSIRTLTELSVIRNGDLITIDAQADGFLYNMVRSITGTLINVGRGYWPPEKVKEILEAKDRTLAGPTAPAKGLFLVSVTYPDSAGG